MKNKYSVNGLKIFAFATVGFFVGLILGIAAILIPAIFISALDQGALLIFVTVPFGVIFFTILGGVYGSGKRSGLLGALIGGIIGLNVPLIIIFLRPPVIDQILRIIPLSFFLFMLLPPLLGFWIDRLIRKRKYPAEPQVITGSAKTNNLK
jgi:hypothetical protein